MKKITTISFDGNRRLTLDPECLPSKAEVAELLASALHDRVRHHEQLGWYVWTGNRWRGEGHGRKNVARLVHAQLSHMLRDAELQNAPKATRRYIKGLLDSENALVKKMEISPAISVEGNCFDQVPYLLNCLNGTVDLRAGGFKPHDPLDMITKQTRLAYDPDAQSPRFQEFLRVVFAENPDLIEYVQKTLGYALTADAGRHAFWVWYGPTGRNGKSVLANAVRAVMGADYSADLDPRSLDRRGRNRIPTDIARLEGIRFLSCREPDAAQQLSAALLKNLVGGDTVVARHLFREEQEFAPHFKLHMLVNRLPQVDNPDEAFWQRVRVIPFNVHVPSIMPVVENLAEKLVAEEGPGVLAWLVRGAVAYFAEGLDEPPEVVAATAAYRVQETQEEAEKLDQSAGEWFIDEWLIKEAGATLAKEVAYKRYCDYTQFFKVLVPVSSKAFGQTMIGHGYERTDRKNFRITDNGKPSRAWFGVRFRQGAEESQAWIKHLERERELDYGPQADSLAQRTGMTREQALLVIEMGDSAERALERIRPLFLDNYRARLERQAMDRPESERGAWVEERLAERKRDVDVQSSQFQAIADMARRLQAPGGNINDPEYTEQLKEFFRRLWPAPSAAA